VHKAKVGKTAARRTRIHILNRMTELGMPASYSAGM
jgi:hypothetical protein